MKGGLFKLPCSFEAWIVVELFGSDEAMFSISGKI